jgi:hypothetical protein
MYVKGPRVELGQIQSKGGDLQMRRLTGLGLALALGLAMVATAAAQVTVTTSLTGPATVLVGEEASWVITIEVCASEDVTGVVVQDGMGADLDDITWDLLTGVSAEKKGKGKMGATMVRWEIGDLLAGECVTLNVTVTTGYNPKDKHEFTSPELAHELDGGASASYWYGDMEYETEETLPLTVDVVEE